MFISMNWIGDFVDLSGLDLEALIHRFTLSTAEVEDVYHMGEDLRGRGLRQDPLGAGAPQLQKAPPPAGGRRR